MAKPTLAKKTAAKKGAMKPLAAAPRKARTLKDDGIYWVISERTFLTWEPKFVYKNKSRAEEVERMLESANATVMQKYKVSRVTLESLL